MQPLAAGRAALLLVCLVLGCRRRVSDSMDACPGGIPSTLSGLRRLPISVLLDADIFGTGALLISLIGIFAIGLFPTPLFDAAGAAARALLP